MSKAVKQLQMNALKQTFGDVRDAVFLSISGVDAVSENEMRLALRKKDIRLHMVKNSLATLVLKDAGLELSHETWTGPTTIAWGGASIAELSKEIHAWVKKNDNIKPKIALADGVVVTYEAAKKFPTREEAIGKVIGLALAPASRIAGQLQSAGARIAGQIKTLKEKSPADEAAGEAA